MAHSGEDAPLASGDLSGSEEVLVAPAAPTGGSNRRAFKIAGLTTLACLLLASQVFTAYMVFDQKQQIHSLRKSSDRFARQMSRSSRAMAPAKMQMPIDSIPLLMDFTSDQDAKTPNTPNAPKPTRTPKTPLTKLKDTVVSLETQLKHILQDFSLPQFNETFLANLQSMKQHVNESEWKSFESWMRCWLIFQMAQQEPAPPTAESVFVIKTKCQTESDGPSRFGSYNPQCDEQGRYLPMQCWHGTGFCWCVDESGTTIKDTAIRGRPDCETATVRPHRLFAARMMQKTVSIDDA